MRKPATLIFSSLTVLLQTTSGQIYADATEFSNYQEESTQYQEEQQEQPPEPPKEAPKEQPPAAPFNAFTGKVTKNKVRLRQQPNLDSPILKELNRNDMIIVTGESDDFYAIQPPGDVKAYIFRTFVLDNVVEGTRVNVRSEPDTEAPVVAQVNAGTRVEGIVSPINSKWLEISMPESARFYVAKEYIEKIGDRSFMATMEKRRDEVNRLLNSTYAVSQSELLKPFPEVNLEGVYDSLNKIIGNYQDFPDQVAKAREHISMIQDNYLQKKITFLESKAKTVSEDWNAKNSQLNDQMKAQQQRLAQLEQQLQKERAAKAANKSNSDSQDSSGLINNKMTAWMPNEKEIYQNWASRNNNKSQDEFYEEQEQQAIALRGIVEPYTRAIKNKPGDYILINQASHLPIAYLYSTQVDLNNAIGHEVTLKAVPRPNNNFAFPAYYILSIE